MRDPDRTVSGLLAYVRLLGDPDLRVRCRPVGERDDPTYLEERGRLVQTLAAFRSKHGFGRGIAAPQIGVPSRFVAIDLADGPFVITNPEIVGRSKSTFTLWDDCMSFPGLLVRVRRHAEITVRYLDEAGFEQTWVVSDRAVAELLQHELDHLDGVLAIDHAIDREAIVLREAFDARPDYFRGLVDHSPGATTE